MKTEHFIFTLASSVIVLVFSTFFISHTPREKKAVAAPPETPQIEVYADESGMPKYASGTCEASTDCVPAGCSQETCSSDPTIITTCIVPDSPDTSVYSCGCVDSQCVWYKQ